MSEMDKIIEEVVEAYNKAWMDTFVYGRGMIKVDSEGHASHIALEAWQGARASLEQENPSG